LAVHRETARMNHRNLMRAAVLLLSSLKEWRRGANRTS
jgi:hypothetical protein